jgi:signal transduction histidine kinase
MSPADFRVLSAVARELASHRDVDALLTVVLDAVVTMTGAERALFALFDSRGRLDRARTWNLDWREGEPLPISNSLVADVLRDGTVCEVTVPSIVDLATRRDSVRNLALRFVLVVPVSVDGRVAGVLYADSRKPGAAEAPDRIAVLQALAGVVGLAIENERLSREQALRTTALAKLVHDLANPLQVVEVAAADLALACPTECVTHVDEIRTALRAIGSSVRTATRFAGVSTQPEPPPEPLRPEILVLEHVQYFRGTAATNSVSLVAELRPDLPRVWSWPDRVRLVLENLVHNAVKYADPGSTIVVGAGLHRPSDGPSEVERHTDTVGLIFRRMARLEPTADATFVEFVVRNQGPTVPADVLARVFDEWVQGDRGVGARADGWGLGLAIVDQCVRSLGGRVWATSADGSTTFSFTLPSAASVVLP